MKKTMSNASSRKIKELLKRTSERRTNEIYDGSLELKIDEGTQEHNDSVVEEVDHDPWAKEPDYGLPSNSEEVVDKRGRFGRGSPIRLKDARNSFEDDEITSEEAFYMEGRDKVLKRKAKNSPTTPKSSSSGKRISTVSVALSVKCRYRFSEPFTEKRGVPALGVNRRKICLRTIPVSGSAHCLRIFRYPARSKSPCR